MDVKPLRTIGGLTLTMFDSDGGNGHLTLQIPREVLSFLGVQCIQEIGPDASADLILACRAVVNAADKAEDQDVEPVWRSDLFTDEERDTMVELQMDEIRDCAKDFAHEELDGAELVDCIGIIDPDSEETTRILQLIGQDEDKHWAGMARENDEDNEYGKVLDFCKRFKLISEDETEVTDLGAKYVASFGNF